MWNPPECRLGIDLGTCNTIIYQKGKGIVLREPSVIALRKPGGQIVAVGRQAQAMIGRTAEAVEVIHPIRDGMVADLPMTLAMLRHFVRKLAGRRLGFMMRPEFVISVPFGIDDVKRRAVEVTTAQLGAKKVTTIEEPLAAAMGAGIPVAEALGHMVVNIGGGITQAAILSLGGLVVGHTVQRGGVSIDENIVEYVKGAYNVVIGERTAEMIKQQIGTAVAPGEDETIEVRGRNLIDGLPKTLTLRATEIHEMLKDFVRSMADAIRRCLEQCPPELVGDILERGIMLCGGGALLRGIDRSLQMKTNVPVFVAEQPLDCIALGTGTLLA